MRAQKLSPKKDLKKKDQKHAWYIRYYVNGKQKTKRGFKTRKDAYNYALNDIQQHEGTPDMKFSNFIDLYFEEKTPEFKPTTLVNRKTIVNKHILPFFGDMPLNEISVKNVRAWHKELRAKGLSDTSLNKINNDFSTILNHAVKYYDLKENPVKRAGSIGSSKPAKEKEIWTLEEFKEFLSHVENVEFKLVYEVLYISGLRIGELKALTPGDIDFDSEPPVINVTKNFQHINGKGHIIQSPKTKSSIREAVISKSLANELKAFCSDLKDDELIFKYAKTTYQSHLDIICSEYGIPRITLHSFRHSAASYLINQGEDVAAVSKQLGHANLSETLDTYAHYFSERNLELSEKLESILE